MREVQLGLYEKSMPDNLDLYQKLLDTKAAGYDYLELSIDESDDKLIRLEYPDAELNALRRATEKTGTPIRSICLSGHRKYPLGDPDPDIRARSMQIMRKAIAFAHKLGVPIIQLAGYDVYYKPSTRETEALFCDNLRLSVEFAAASGVTLAFETMETPFLNTTEKAMVWVNKMQSPWLQVYPDLGNITNAFDGCRDLVIKDIETGRGHIPAMHLKETAPGVFRGLSYGQGHVDFAGGAGKAYSMGVRMFVGEFWYNGQDDWRNLLFENRLFLRDVLDKISL